MDLTKDAFQRFRDIAEEEFLLLFELHNSIEYHRIFQSWQDKGRKTWATVALKEMRIADNEAKRFAHTNPSWSSSRGNRQFTVGVKKHITKKKGFALSLLGSTNYSYQELGLKKSSSSIKTMPELKLRRKVQGVAHCCEIRSRPLCGSPREVWARRST